MKGNTMKNSRISNLKYAAAPLALGLALISTPSFAQDAAAEEETAEAIIVTGSRIARPDLESVSPVTTVTSEQIELTGTVTVESLINDLPQVIPGNNRSSNNSGGENFATLDLRGLGANRTLILLDGERLAASSTTGVTDVSQIPTALIKRVDVVTGGATAVYGSDAMAGVINFVLKDDYQGAEVSSQVGTAEAGLGQSFNVQGVIGGNFDDGRGNITISASYFDREAVSQNDFDWSRISAALGIRDGNLVVVDDPSDVASPSDVIFAGGSGTNPYGSIQALAGNPFRNLSTLLPATFAGANTDCNAATAGVAVNSGTLTFNDAGKVIPNAASGFCQIPVGSSSRYNFAPNNYLSIPFNRLNVAFTSRYELAADTTLKIYGTYARTESTQALAPTPAAGGTGFVVPADSPLIPADLRIALDSRANPTAPFQVNRRFAETGPRIGINRNNSFQIRGNVDHKFSDNWRGNVVASFGRTDFDARSIGNINRTAVEAGLNGCKPGGTAATAGTASSPFGVPEGCIPINIFGKNTLTPKMVKYIQTDTYDASSFEQVRFAANLTGSLFEIVENDPVAVAVGAEYRKDTGSSTPDDAKVRGEIIGFNQANPLAGTINAKEVYGELRVPLLEMLSVEAGARYSKYSTVGGLFNYKFGAEFKPFDALKFRGAYNKAARAPAVFELFQNGDQGFPTYVDPCGASRNPSAAVLGLCRSQAPGFDFAGFAQNNTQVQAFAFGNPDLAEERAETWTVGAVFSSGNVLGGTFSATADWYNIEITNLNAALGSSYFLNDCYTNANSASCARIQRSAATGQIDRISTTRENSDSALSTKGLDVSVNYALPLDAIFSGADGRIRIANLFTYVDSYKVGDTELVGLTSDGIGGTTSKYANTMTVGYENGAFTTQVRWVYKAGGNQDNALFGNDEDAGFDTPKIPDLSVFDLSTRLRITDNFSATFIVDNVFDKTPPQTATGTFEQANSNVSFYEPYLLGRGYTIQATLRF